MAIHTARLARSQWWSAAEIERYQRAALVRVMRYAVAHVPFYRSLGIDVSEIQSESDLLRFPVLTKSMVQDLGADLVSDDHSTEMLYSSRTSGSTGEPTVTYFDGRAWYVCKYALKIRRMTANGVGFFKHIVVVSEQTPQELRQAEKLLGADVLFRQTMLSIHEPVDEHVAVLRDRHFAAIYGFPSYFEELIDYCNSRGIKLQPMPVVFTSSEVLRPATRETIARFFGGRVCDVYGSTEFKEVAWQCQRGRHHLNFESVWAESRVSEEADGRATTLLLTSLLNEAMPLIRYEVGDFAEINKVPCDCGRASPVIEAIAGREIDMVTLPDGRKISPYLLTTSVEKSPIIRKYQLVQLAADHVMVSYVPRHRDDLDTGFEAIAEQLKRHLGTDVAVSFHAVDEIRRTERGKHRVLVKAPSIDRS